MSKVHYHRFHLNSTDFVTDSPPASPTQPAPPTGSPCLVTGPSLAAQTPPGQSSTSAGHRHESGIPPITGDSPVNGVLINRGTSTTDDILIIKCRQCSTLNVILTAKDCWYVIFCSTLPSPGYSIWNPWNGGWRLMDSMDFPDGFHGLFRWIPWTG